MSTERTLSNNKISQFILRIDLTPESRINFTQLVDDLKSEYGSFSTEIKNNIEVNYNIQSQRVEVKNNNYLFYNLGTPPSVVLKLDSLSKSITMLSNHYDNKNIYTDRFRRMKDLIIAHGQNVKAQRIGMRFVNSFDGLKRTEISKILEPNYAKIIRSSLENDNISRAMVVHEYQNGSNRARVQFGIPNKFYPSIISSLDLVLDIDVYESGIMPITEWEDNIDEYNHNAYDLFINYIKDTFIESLK